MLNSMNFLSINIHDTFKCYYKFENNFANTITQCLKSIFFTTKTFV